MIVLKINTSAGKRVMGMFDRCDSVHLSEIFKEYSKEKENAYNYCRELFKKEGGLFFRIARCGTFGFIASWVVREYNENGYVIGEHYRVETRTNSYKVER